MTRKKLAQIKTEEIPPLHQSSQVMTGCHLNYRTQVIDGNKKPGGVESLRGREIHAVAAAYQSHCARRQVAMDLDAFDQLAKGAGREASKILSGIRDHYQVDYAHLFTTESVMDLDEDLQPTNVLDIFQDVLDSGKKAAYRGTPDSI